MSFSVAETFNNHLTEEERATLQKGEILIKKINYSRYICLNNGLHEAGDLLIKNYKDLSPKYLAEVIQIKPYAGNEDLPERMEKLLSNISDYAGIPYYSERHDAWWDLYSSAKIVSETENEYGKEYLAEIDMTPFGIVKQQININQYDDVLLYDSINLNKLSYFDRFDCVFPKKMKMSILLLRDGDNWVLYGIGGVNAPRIPFFTERIDTSFINRIKTFCYYIFEKL
ncbi:MAG: hypothetical protein MJ182_04240 [Treponema sp.]|nr:hypothetical protein [Treponema sp.]